MTKLSVLDLSFTTTATPASRALAQTIELARFVDALGFTRFWVAEHHSLVSIAGPAPEIMIGQIAAATRHLRVGSGGVMLPNHAPLMVAERFKMLEALFPGRIDLGLGRAPGTDPVTSYALRHRDGSGGDDDFIERLSELRAWAGAVELQEGHPFRRIRVMPDDVPLPPLWMLGSSEFGARVAAKLGLGFAFAHHFASYDARAAMLDYRTRFQPSQANPEPYAILALAAVCAETDAEAEVCASSADLAVLWRKQGRFGPLISPQEALARPYTDIDRAMIAANRSQLLVGSPASVKRQIDELAGATRADEVMITTAMFDQAARHRSFALLAEAFGMSGAGSGQRLEAAE